MNHEQVTVASEQLRTLTTPFQRLYVKKAKVGRSVLASYVVMHRDTGFIYYYRTVDLKTGMLVDEDDNLGMNRVAVAALDEHYSLDYVRSDALVQMQELCGELNSYPSDTFSKHAVFGQEIYHADLEELNLGNDAYIALR